jgi:hypothetical protein
MFRRNIPLLRYSLDTAASSVARPVLLALTAVLAGVLAMDVYAALSANTPPGGVSVEEGRKAVLTPQLRTELTEPDPP